ncbi:Histidine kinase-, DNA gyrase B-, and HSP90-like ATPase [Priestia megaterium]|nr:Histidine kinase-, DNA gyrase B-, and HSP90-like ATPase [Priestia megaterium]
MNSITESFNPLMFDTNNSLTEKYNAEIMRNNILEIIGSYHHQFDHPYECIQNAVDGCEKLFYSTKKMGLSIDYVPKVQIIVNLLENSLIVIDNGFGMSKEILQKYFFTPYATIKSIIENDESIRQRGEKGVGATFLSYGCNFIHVTSKSAETSEVTSGVLRNALNWCDKGTNLLPMPVVEPYSPHQEIHNLDHGTVVEIHFSENTNINDLNEHGINCEHWESILRLHTALGYIDNSEDSFLKGLRAELTVVSEEGIDSKLIETGYLYPHLTTESSINLDSLVRTAGRLNGRLKDSQRDMNIVWKHFSYDEVSEIVSNRMEKSRYMRQKKKTKLSQILNKHKPQIYVAFTYGSDFWEERNHEIWGEELDGHLKHGITFSTKSQKIGENKRIDFSFRTGDFNRFFILLSMKNLKGDIGRKSLNEDIEEFANFFANGVHNTFTKNIDCLRPSPGPFDENQEAELEEIKDSALETNNIDIKELAFIKEPREEQDVIGLFFNLLGLNIIKGYKVYSTHISRTYDGVGKFILNENSDYFYSNKNILGVSAEKFRNKIIKSPTKCFIEFKFTTDGLVRDIRSGYKRLQDIKWLVCWEIGDKHVSEGIGLIDITVPAQINQRDYHGVTHLMTEGQDKVYVICLKTIIEILKK